MAIITQLSPHVADLIAAGEVVERPGSVVKELVENAIDAGARHVTVEIQNGGMTLLRVTDDGCGMDRQDAQTAFLRHATSKLHKAEDLAAIGTLGFRGEALAAISAVARVNLLTRTADADEGTAVTLEGGVITACDPAGCPKGTTMVVRDLFYNTPARLKFMKSDVSEGANVSAVVQRLALAHPEIAFRLIRDNQEVFSAVGDGQLRTAAAAVFGRTVARDMVAVEGHWDRTTVSGLVTLPTASRGNRSGQLFYVNGRFVRSKTMTAALEEAYRNQIMAGRYPACVLNVRLPLNAVDVNVHPAKTEVRFLAERAVFDSVLYAVRAALNKAPGVKDVDLPQPRPAGTAPAASAARPAAGRSEGGFRRMDAADFRAVAAALGQPVTPSKRAVEALLPMAEERRAPVQPAAPPAPARPVRPAGQTVLCSEVTLPRSAPAEPEPAQTESSAPAPMEPPAAPAAEEAPVPAAAPAAEPEQTALPLRAETPWRVVGEVLDSFFVVEEPGAVLFIDKHAAHERILFEKLKRQDSRPMSQLLLAPIPAALSREDAAALLDQADLLRQCGYELEDFGDHTVLIRAIPDDIDEADAEATLAALAADLRGGRRADPDSLRDDLLHTIACKAAIKAGWHTEPQERDALIREVMTRDDLKYCPHGRPICIRMTEGTLRRQFKRS